MANAYLENTGVTELKSEYTVSALEKKFAKAKEEQKKFYDESGAVLKDINESVAEQLKDRDAAYVFSESELIAERADREDDRLQAVERGAAIKKENEFLKKYGDSFARLYQIKDTEEKFGEGAKLEFVEISTPSPVGIITQEQYYEPKNETTQIGLAVELDAETKFRIAMLPYDKPGSDKKEVKAQLSFDDDALKTLNAEKLSKIMEFCELHGMPTFQMDIPYSFDGNIDINEKMSALLHQVQENKRSLELAAANQEYSEREANSRVLDDEIKQAQAAGREIPETPSPDMPRSGTEFAMSEGTMPENASADNNAQRAMTMPQQQAQSVTPQQPNPAPQKEKTLKDAEEGLEKFLEGGLKKYRNSSYFKTHTKILKRGWTEYIVYDKEDRDNRKKDGKRDKNGEPKFTYSFKLFVKKDKDGFRFAYRTPSNKKIDDSVINGLAGQFKSLGITHVSFPDGLADAEKKLWRIALAENGIVPKGMGLDRAKAEGMLKAAKEKLSTEEFKKFRYRLAVQMEKDNIDKGKVVSPSEQDFIEGLKSSQKYLAFTDGYNGKLKSMLRDRLDKADTNKYDGALDKIALYKTMRRLFDVYKETADSGSILDSGTLSAEEKSKLRAAGLTGPVSEFNEAQMGELFEIMLPQDKKDAYKELDEALLAAKDTENRTSKGAKRADNIIIKEVFDGARNRFEKVNEILTSLGVEEITFPKAFGRLYYEDRFYSEHPEFLKKPKPQQNTNTPAQPAPAPAPTPAPAQAPKSAQQVNPAMAARAAKQYD